MRVQSSVWRASLAHNPLLAASLAVCHGQTKRRLDSLSHGEETETP